MTGSTGTSMGHRPVFAPVWHRLPAPVHLVLFAAVVLGVGLASVALFSPPGMTVAVWWPVAGVGSAALLLARRDQQSYVVAVHAMATGAVNHLGGHPPEVAAALGLANGLEIVVVAVVIAAGRADPLRLHEPADLGRLVTAVVAGASAISLSVGVITGLAHGTPLLTTLASLWPSHTSALLLVLLVVLRGLPSEASGPGEQLAQWALATGMTAAVFAPGQTLPLAFLLFPALLWTALRSSVRALGVQLVTVAALATFASLQGAGPFAGAADGTGSLRLTVALLQLLMFTLAVVMVAVRMAMSSRRHALDLLEARSRRMQQAFDQALAGMLVVRAEGDALPIVEANPAATRFLAEGALQGRDWSSFLTPADTRRLLDGANAVRVGEREVWQGELPVQLPTEVRWLQVSVSRLGVGPEPDLLSAQLLDVTSHRDHVLHLTDLATQDALTGLSNRLRFEEHLRALLAEARRGATFAMLYLDLDGFKPVNDRFGHAVGDQVLVATADRLRAMTRKVDTVARLGGDEFAVLCPDADDLDALRALAARICEAIEVPVPVESGEVRVSASVGVALGDPTLDAAENLAAVDREMYRAKLARG